MEQFFQGQAESAHHVWRKMIHPIRSFLVVGLPFFFYPRLKGKLCKCAENPKNSTEGKREPRFYKSAKTDQDAEFRPFSKKNPTRRTAFPIRFRQRNLPPPKRQNFRNSNIHNSVIRHM